MATRRGSTAMTWPGARPRGFARDAGPTRFERLLAGLAIVVVCVVAGRLVVWNLTLALFVLTAGAAAGLFILFGQLGYRLVAAWAPLSVLAYPFLRLPPHQTVATFDRVWVGAMISRVLMRARTVAISRSSW